MSRSQQNADYLAQYNWMPYRNKLINGDFRIDQRYAGTSTTSSGPLYVPDRWVMYNTTGTLTKQRVANGPYGNTYSLQMTVTGAGTRISSDVFSIDQRIEGQNVNDLQWGYSTAKTCTLSFWVKNSLTGTYGGTVKSGNVTRSYGFTYTVNSASTWEYKTIVIPGDVTGGATAYPADNTLGLVITFGFGSGTTNSLTAGSWQVISASDVTGTASWAQTAGAVVNISMVQFEVGSVATPFENRPIGVELALCQRYYEKSYNQDTVPGTNTGYGCKTAFAHSTSLATGFNWVVPKRLNVISPGASLTMYSISGTFDSSSNASGVNIGVSASGMGDCSMTGARHLTNSSNNWTAGQLIYFHYIVSAEL